MHKQTANHFDPLLTETRITTIFHEDDFDFQFENLITESMFDITENKSYDIAAYGFGKKIEQHGFEILSCVCQTR